MTIDISELQQQQKKVELYKERQDIHEQELQERFQSLLEDNFEITKYTNGTRFTHGPISISVHINRSSNYKHLEVTINKSVNDSSVASVTFKDVTEYQENVISPYVYETQINNKVERFSADKIETLLQFVIDAEI